MFTERKKSGLNLKTLKITAMLAVFMICALGIKISSAEVLSEHNEQHAAEMAAMNKLYDSGCQRIDIKRTERFTLHDDGAGFLVKGNGLSVRCVSWPGFASYSVTWKSPTKRENGDVLTVDEISGYEIWRGEKYLFSVECCAFDTESIDGLRIRTVDTTGNKSRFVSVN